MRNSEIRVKEILGQKFDNQYLLVEGVSPQALLENEEKILPILDDIKAKNIVGSYQAISLWLPSINQQKIDNELLINAASKQ